MSGAALGRVQHELGSGGEDSDFQEEPHIVRGGVGTGGFEKWENKSLRR
jgi:hypothetical protein